jgi:hypothetical protein
MFRCCNHNPILILYMSYHRVCNNSNKTGATHGAGTAYLFGVHPQFLWGSCCSIANFLCRVLWIIVCPCVLFRLKFNLSVLRFMASCYPLALLSSCYPLDIFLFPLDIFLLPPWYLLATPLISSCYPLDIFLLPPWYLLVTSLDIFLLPPWYLPVTPLISSCYLLISSNLN